MRAASWTAISDSVWSVPGCTPSSVIHAHHSTARKNRLASPSFVQSNVRQAFVRLKGKTFSQESSARFVLVWMNDGQRVGGRRRMARQGRARHGELSRAVPPPVVEIEFHQCLPPVQHPCTKDPGSANKSVTSGATVTTNGTDTLARSKFVLASSTCAGRAGASWAVILQRNGILQTAGRIPPSRPEGTPRANPGISTCQNRMIQSHLLITTEEDSKSCRVFLKSGFPCFSPGD